MSDKKSEDNLTNKNSDSTTYLRYKRLFDVISAVTGLVILSPLLLLVAILIKIDDPSGPVFYSQIRVGKNESEFRMYKFRSMYNDADKRLKKLLQYNEVDGAMFKMKEDPRITRVGKIIRKYSIDEIPQLWNVIKGDMTVVGPRPALPREITQYTDHDRQRLVVKPGCTGLWQVGARSAVGFDEMVRLDLEYIRTRNTWLDIKIMFKTVKIMIIPNETA
ncbi:sugar transferase [Lentilactobacillus senioris]|uniref:sugar transferase n=1 Tax=Lentilactobacillus senioris TaxID=931534 RepID=UPI002282A953|nr:sugar transferase [Lentilactobacillus senioris]MCY9806003.1 sugar transferase [Lentilactobacillus senioris]